MAKDCRKKARNLSQKVQQVTRDGGEPDAEVEQLEADGSSWIHGVTVRSRMSRSLTTTLFFVLDSGSMINVVPVDLVKKFGAQPHLSRTLLIKGAGGAKLAHFGRVIITLNIGEHSMKFCAEVAAVHRPLLSVGAGRTGCHSIGICKRHLRLLGQCCQH